MKEEMAIETIRHTLTSTHTADTPSDRVYFTSPLNAFLYVSQVQGEFHMSDLSHAVHQLHLQLLHRGAAVELDTVQRILSEDVYVELDTDPL